MSSLVVTVTRIAKIRLHPAADKLDIAEVLGWQVVVGKGQFCEGDRVVFFPPDSVLPQHQSDRFGVTKYLSKGRVKCAKLRGEPSYGLVIKPDDETWEDGKDVAEHYGVTKYDPPPRITAEDAEDEHPLFHPYIQMENLRNFPDVFEAGEEVVVVEKVDGSNCRVGLVENVFMAGSHELRRKAPRTVESKLTELGGLMAVWRRETHGDSTGRRFDHPAYQQIIGLGRDVVPALLQQLEVDPHWWFDALLAILKKGPEIPVEVQGRLGELAKLWVTWSHLHGYDRPVKRVNPYWLPLLEDQYPAAANVKRLLTEMAGAEGHRPSILFGEVFGPGMQDFNYGRKALDFCVFDFSYVGRYFDYDELVELCTDYKVPLAPLVYRGPFDITLLRKLADEKSSVGGDRYREGVVVRPVKERRQEFRGAIRRVILKLKGDKYLTGDHTDYKDS